MWNKLFKNEQGFTLVFTVLAIMLISILGLSLMTTTANSKKISQSEYVDQSAYYIAEAGLSLAISAMDAKIKEAKEKAVIAFSNLTEPRDSTQLEHLYSTELKDLLFDKLNSIENDVNNYSDFDSSNTTININITEIPDSPSLSLTIISTGSIDGQKRTVKQDIAINGLTPSTEIESAIRRDLTGTLGTGYTLEYEIDENNILKKFIVYDSVKLKGKSYINLTGDHFKDWIFEFNILDMPGNGVFVTSADIRVYDLKFTGVKACIQAGNNLEIPESSHAHPDVTYTQSKANVDYKGGGCLGISPTPTPTPPANLYELSKPIEINTPS